MTRASVRTRSLNTPTIPRKNTKSTTNMTTAMMMKRRKTKTTMKKQMKATGKRKTTSSRGRPKARDAGVLPAVASRRLTPDAVDRMF
jgi:hypothetical protein